MPLHEFMQATHVAHKLIAGTQIEVIGIAQYQRGMDIFEMLRGKGLDRCLCADRCKNRCDEIAMRGSEDSSAGAVVFRSYPEFEHAVIIRGGEINWKSTNGTIVRLETLRNHCNPGERIASLARPGYSTFIEAP